MAKRKARGNGEPVNQSAEIRAILAQNPKTPVKEIVAQLAQRGIKVRPTMVYYVKSKQKHQKRAQKRQRVAETSQNIGVANPVELVLRAKSLARDAGGIKKLKQLIDALAE
jgi:hypothetical protein